MEAGELLELNRVDFERVPLNTDPLLLLYLLDHLVDMFGTPFLEGFFGHVVKFDENISLVGAVTGLYNITVVFINALH